MKTLLLSLALISVSAAAEAGSVNMSCEQAKATYWRNGRINVRTNSGAVVPIYGLRRGCPFQYWASPYSVRTSDRRSCTLGVRCYRNDHH